MKQTSRSHHFPTIFYILTCAGLLLDCNAWALSSANQQSGTRFQDSVGPTWQISSGANSGRNQSGSLPGLRSKVSHIYHKSSPYRPPDCDDECIHELRINNTLSQINLRRNSEKLQGWQAVVNSGYQPRQIAGEWYATFQVGTPRPNSRQQSVELALDTGSPFTWFQCKPCGRCFPQRLRLFNHAKSTSYRALNQNDGFCNILRNYRGNLYDGAGPDFCLFRQRYADESLGRGSVSYDSFKLEDTNNPGRLLDINPIGFGCGFDNEAAVPSSAGGVLGLANSRAGISIAEQLSPLWGSSFSYCLTSLNEPANSGYILFGPASAPTGNYPRTEFRISNAIYFVDAVDFSVNGVRLNLPPGSFPHGTIVDSETPFSLLPSIPFDRLVGKLSETFERLGAPYYPPNRALYGPCWGTSHFDQHTFPFPRVALHFSDGNAFQLSTAATFVLYRTRSHSTSVCLPFLKGGDPLPEYHIVGGHATINTVMYFDQPNRRLGWVYNAC